MSLMRCVLKYYEVLYLSYRFLCSVLDTVTTDCEYARSVSALRAHGATGEYIVILP